MNANTGRAREAGRAAQGWRWIERAGHDLRYAARLLGRRPAFSATAILTLMLGTGGTTAVFSLFDALLMRHLPVERPEELVRLIERRADGTAAQSVTLVTYDTLRERESQTLSGIIAGSDIRGRPAEIAVSGERRSAYVQMISDNYFDVLGIRAFRGRLLRERQPGEPGEPIAVISESYWRRQYGSDPSVLGTRVRRGKHEFTIVGITPPGFRGTEVDVPIDIWVPIEQMVAPDDEDRFRGRWIRVMGRLRPGMTPAAAQAESTGILGRPVEFEPGGTGYSTLRVRLYRPLLLVALVVALVLLIACANLANLMLAANASRQREIAVRAAIGASRGRIVSQLMTEALVLSAAGAALGLAVAWWTSTALLAFLPPAQAVAAPNLRFALDARVLGCAASLAVATCVLFGLGPALRVARGTAPADLKAGAGSTQRSRSWLSRGLLVSQVVMCTVLLIVAGVFLRTLQNLRGQDAGYREDRLLVADVQPPYEYPEERRDLMIEELRARVAGLPGVEIAAFGRGGQLSGSAIEFPIAFPGSVRPESNPASCVEERVSPGFFAAMGTRLVSGRDFTSADDERSALVAIVNESFARTFLPGRDPIGLRFFRETGSQSGELMEIVGVVQDVKWLNLRDDSVPMYYRPYRQVGGTPIVRFAIRTSGDPEPLARALPAVAQTIDRRLVLTNVVPFREIVDRTLVIERLVGQVSTAFGVLALVIAAVGLYGVLAYSVARRRKEIGVRIAIGARPGAIERMFLAESVILLVVGVAAGIPAAIAITRFASGMLFGLSPQDPASIGLAVAVLAVATLCAAYLPARRAARIDPIAALREE